MFGFVLMRVTIATIYSLRQYLYTQLLQYTGQSDNIMQLLYVYCNT